MKLATHALTLHSYRHTAAELYCKRHTETNHICSMAHAYTHIRSKRKRHIHRKRMCKAKSTRVSRGNGNGSNSEGVFGHIYATKIRYTFFVYTNQNEMQCLRKRGGNMPTKFKVCAASTTAMMVCKLPSILCAHSIIYCLSREGACVYIENILSLDGWRKRSTRNAFLAHTIRFVFFGSFVFFFFSRSFLTFPNFFCDG